MAKQVILDWQRDSLLLASGSGRGSKVVLDRLSLQPIGEVEGAEVNNSNAEEALHRAVSDSGVGKADVVVVASREMVEVRTVAVPRMDAAELPDVIRFQAQRQLSNMGDTWPLDYVLLPDVAGQEMLTALVGVISPAHMAEIDSICHSAGLTVTHVAMRPLEIARFAVASGLMSAGNNLVVCAADGTADLLILRDNQPVQVRCTKLPSDIEAVGKALKGEIRRSVMAAGLQLAGQSLDGVVLIAPAAMAQAAQAAVGEAAGAPVQSMDPGSLLAGNIQAKTELVRRDGHRIVAIAGALNVAVADKKTTFDFKNPKKRPPKQRNTRTYLLAAAAAAVLVLGGIYWWSSTNARLDRELQALLEENTAKAETVEMAEKRIAELQQIQGFLEASPNWLDELSYISERMPASEKVLIYDAVFTSSPVPQVRINTVFADSPESIREFEESLQDDRHQVIGNDKSELPKQSQVRNYKWRSTETIQLFKRGWDLEAALAGGSDLAAEAAEPSQEVPTPEVPTPEVPTPEVPAPEVPAPGVPANEESTERESPNQDSTETAEQPSGSEIAASNES